MNCAHCGVDFGIEVVSERAMEEYRRNFPEVASDKNEPSIILCDDCYRRAMSAIGRSII